ncbi:MAG: AAA family ATPase, partial [Nitrospiraceae bacterium]|nr:AAA family ATPase [Nitrospiraceae bacterium]
GLGKSSLGLFCAMLSATGETVADIGAVRGKPMYLDYEDSAEVHVRRMQAIAAAHAPLAGAEVSYQACTEPLWHLAPLLLRRIHAEGFTFLVLDSLLAATGGDAGSEATTKVFRALRTLQVEVLILAHVPKTPGEGQDHQTVYGSVFSQNFARSVWELKKEQEVGEDVSILGLFNRKSNLSRLHAPIGLKVTQNRNNTIIAYEPFDLSQAAELAPGLPLPARIRNLLEDGAPRTAKEIADALGAKLSSVKATLSKFAGHKWMMLGGQGQETKWTVLTPK